MLYFYSFNKGNREDFIEFMEKHFSEDTEVSFIHFLNNSTFSLKRTPFFPLKYIKCLSLSNNNCFIQIRGKLKKIN